MNESDQPKQSDEARPTHDAESNPHESRALSAQVKPAKTRKARVAPAPEKKPSPAKAARKVKSTPAVVVAEKPLPKVKAKTGTPVIAAKGPRSASTTAVKSAAPKSPPKMAGAPKNVLSRIGGNIANLFSRAIGGARQEVFAVWQEAQDLRQRKKGR